MSAALVLALVAAFLVAPPALAEVKPFGVLDCVAQSGVRFCPGSIDTRVPSFDDVPLDVDVTLPASGDENHSLVILLHGWGGAKPRLAATAEWARRGYAVLAFSARGFGHSCGSLESRSATPVECARGWTHIADLRYEIRDAQHLAGLLADQGIVAPERIGVLGNSYGAAESLALAVLNDRVMLPKGTQVGWRSPALGLTMRIAAAISINGWSDFASAFQPNGRDLDYAVGDAADTRSPVGVLKESYASWFYDQGAATGYYAPLGADWTADINGLYRFFESGEPYNATTGYLLLQRMQFQHSAAYLEGTPAPILIAGGFTDDLFPVTEQLRFVNRHPSATVAQFYADVGHDRAQRKPADLARREALVHAWFDHYLKGDETVVPPSGVEAWTQTCPSTAPSGGPYTAPSWSELQRGEVRVNGGGAQRVTSDADALGAAVDPLTGAGACAALPTGAQKGVATYTVPAAAAPGYTMLGSPTVIAELSMSPFPDPKHTLLAARLWDVAPDKTQTLVTRGVFRPSSGGQAVFQLHPNGWRFAPGHAAKLEVLGRDAPYARTSNFPFSYTVKNLQLRLPTADPPDAVQVRTPLARVMPAGSTPVR